MMEDQPPLTSSDGSSNRNNPERCPCLLHSPQEICNQKTEDMVECDFKVEEEEIPINIRQGNCGGNNLQKYPDSEYFNKSGAENEEDKAEDNKVGLNVIIKPEEEEGAQVAIKEEGEHSSIIPVDLQKKTSQNYETANDVKCKERLSELKSDDIFVQDAKPAIGQKILVINHRTLTGDKPFSCNECGGFFKHKSSLVLHRRIHSGEKPYSCSDCGKQFIQKANYLRHQRLHTGEKPYKCTECGKQYAQKQSLVLHQKFHTENEPFSCPECGASFIRQSHLVNHRKTHKGLRRYICSDCGDFFMLRSSLVIHQKVHSAEKPFSS